MQILFIIFDDAAAPATWNGGFVVSTERFGGVAIHRFLPPYRVPLANKEA